MNFLMCIAASANHKTKKNANLKMNFLMCFWVSVHIVYKKLKKVYQPWVERFVTPSQPVGSVWGKTSC